MNQEEREGFHGDDPQEILRTENQIKKLKMMAETGAIFIDHSEVSPEIEALFLKNVENFENAWKDVKMVKVREFLGNPEFIREEELDDAHLEGQLEYLNKIMNENQMVLDGQEKYDDRTIYKFITEELFEVETDDMRMEGFVKHFMYEEFHPDHKADISSLVKDFLKQMFVKKEIQWDWYFHNVVEFEGIILRENEINERLRIIMESFQRFKNLKYDISKISFDWNEEAESGNGFAEGDIKYEAELENGEVLKRGGPFRLDVTSQYGAWTISGVKVPGLNQGL